ncbi:carbohydrate ABC transporter substrate-binding protein (CUT1 family) [Scopulibacillus darangshiensis]|uniref:Carbohydrate ABC transporter substrate-binding protein (CUT1 family) n=1 Tax=Scopulibacillus darangshiensis TaxID=442528 RepID=A0A4R2NQ73_9BACL|nr:extracellular solute-binding protein [Scopulibacillus darangshiensis]TCP23524.1 carbohydrate ABC transporter substrate-binding protein (CUT1 family) [Scopulibacillus darangshiensis]
MKPRKCFVFVTMICMFFLTALTGCTDSKETSKNVKQTDENGKLVELSYFVPNYGPTTVIKDYNDIAAYQVLERETGIHVDFQHPASDSDEVTQQFNLMMASGDLPDVIEYIWTNASGGPSKYLEGGQIIKLNKYIKKYAPNLSRVLKEHPDWKKQISTDDGSIYGFPFLRSDPELLTSYGPIIRKDWLDKLNLKIPTTIDEWHNVLKAFKEKDPNGNGKADEIPLLPALTSNAFIGAWGITPDFYQVNGKVKYGPTEPEFKAFLKVMHQWYKEGLIDKGYVATDGKLQDAKVTGNKLGAFMGYNGGSLGRYMGLMKEKNPDFRLEGIPYPTLQKGEKPIVGQKDSNFNGVAAAISGDNDHVKQTMKWLDRAYSDKGHLLFNFGVEGKSYKMVDGKPKYTKKITDNPDGLPMQEALAKYVRVAWSGPFVQDKGYVEQYYQLPEQKTALKNWSNAKNDILLPPITATPEESKQLSSIMNDINTYRETMVNKFVMGKEPLSKFDSFVKTLKGMGIEKAVKMKQAALDRYNKR